MGAPRHPRTAEIEAALLAGDRQVGIAESLGVPQNTVAGIAYRLRAEGAMPRKARKAKTKVAPLRGRILAMSAQGADRDEVAKALNVSVAAIGRVTAPARKAGELAPYHETKPRHVLPIQPPTRDPAVKASRDAAEAHAERMRRARPWKPGEAAALIAAAPVTRCPPRYAVTVWGFSHASSSLAGGRVPRRGGAT